MPESLKDVFVEIVLTIYPVFTSGKRGQFDNLCCELIVNFNSTELLLSFGSTMHEILASCCMLYVTQLSGLDSSLRGIWYFQDLKEIDFHRFSKTEALRGGSGANSTGNYLNVISSIKT